MHALFEGLYMHTQNPLLGTGGSAPCWGLHCSLILIFQGSYIFLPHWLLRIVFS